MRMKTILLSAYACVPNHGSEEGNGWNYATLLSQEGLRVHCLTRDKGRIAIESILEQGGYPNLTVHYVTVPDWLERAYGNTVGMYLHYIYWQWKAAQLACKLDEQHNFGLVHHVTYSSIQLGSFLYRVGKPFIFGPVGGGQQAPASMKRYFGPFWSRERMRDWVSGVLAYVNPGFFHTLKVADLVLISNADTLRLAKQFRPTQPIERVLDAGLGDAFLPSGPIERNPGNSLKLLWIGRLMPRKALELTIHAFSKVDPTLPITLTIVGGQGEMADQVDQYLDHYGVRNRVKWVGHVSYEEVKRYYEQSDVFLFTSLRDSCPMQIMEAMAYSMPVVTLALHGQDELVNENTGIKVAVTEPEQVTTDLARAVEWLYAHPDQRLAMGSRAYKFALSQVWSGKIKTYTEELYPALFGQHEADAVVTDRRM